MREKVRYPRPGSVGGFLIRGLIGHLKRHEVALPISSYILIATSGGSDSTALAHLIAKYGRRVGGRAAIKLLHVNHGWRGAESDADAAFVRRLGKELGVKTKVVNAKTKPLKGESWEDAARRVRKSVFAKEAGKDGVVLTAHTADDLAETVLWRVFTGSAGSHGGGILVRDGERVRPFLTFRKEQLRAYLREEGQEWREDRTNHEGRFLRSKMRQELMPLIEALFPRAIDHLVALGLSAQRRAATGSGAAEKARGGMVGAMDDLMGVIQAQGLRLRRTQWVEIEKFLLSEGARELHLPSGYRLLRESAQRGGSKKREEKAERVVLEKIIPKR